MSAAFSPIMMLGALVLPPTSVGMIEASATRSALHAAHAQLRVDYGHGIVAHLAGTDRVVLRVGAIADVLLDGLRVALVEGIQAFAANGRERACVENATLQVRTGHHHRHVGRGR